jgi:proton glutamate symport protein
MRDFWHTSKIAAPQSARQVRTDAFSQRQNKPKKIALIPVGHVKMSRPEFPMEPNQQSTKLGAQSGNRTTVLLQVAGFTLLALGFALLHFAPIRSATASIRWVALVLLGVAGLRKRNLTFWIFLAMLIGLEIGLDWPAVAAQLKILSDIFLRLIKVIVAPLILGTLITGVAGHGDVRKVGRIGWKSLLYFEVITTIALVVGVVSINLTRAGEGLTLPPSATAEAAPQTISQLKWDDFVLHVFPENIVKAVGENQILQVAVFAILFALALSRVAEKYRAPMLTLAESLTQVMFSFTKIVMYYAPIGVGAAMAYTVGHMGTAVLLPLSKLVLTAYAALLCFLLFVLLPVALFARVPLKRF